jgi:hypothetical protein
MQDENKTKLTEIIKQNKTKIIFTIVIAFLILISGVIGYFIGINRVKNDSNHKLSNRQITLSSKPTPPLLTIRSAAISPSISPGYQGASFINATYTNEKYNFKFEYLSKEYIGGQLDSTYTLQQINDNQFIITESDYDGNGKISNTESSTYTVYDANTTDKDNLVSWWGNNIKTDIGSYTVPDDYTTQLNITPFSGCMTGAGISWQMPPLLDVRIKDSVLTQPTDFSDSVYMYYDYGKPFIIHTIPADGGGACDENPENYLFYTSLSMLQ